MTTLSLDDSLKTAIRIATSFAKENRNEQLFKAHLLRALLHKEIGLHPFLKSLNKCKYNKL